MKPLRILKWLGFVVVLLAAVVVLVSLLVVQTEPGTRWAVRQAVGRAPAFMPGLAVGYDSLSGTLVAGLNIEGLEVVVPAEGGSHRIAADTLEFQWNPFLLADSLLRVTRIDVSGLDLALTPSQSEEPSDLRATLDTMFSLPLAFAVDEVRVRGFALAMEDFRLDAEEIAAAALALDRERVGAGELRWRAATYAAEAAGVELRAGSLELAGSLEWQVMLPDQPEVSGAAEVGGSLERIVLEHRLLAPVAVATEGSVAPGVLEQAPPAFEFTHVVEGLAGPLPAGMDVLEGVSGRLSTGGSAERVDITLDLQAALRGVEPLAIDFDAVYAAGSLEIANLNVAGAQVDFASSGRLGFSPALDLQAVWRVNRLDASAWVSQVSLEEVQGNGSVALSMGGDGLDGRLDLTALSGRLNGHPLDAGGSAELVAGALEQFALDLRARDNLLRLEGGLQPALDVAWSLDAPALGVLLPELSGALEGEGTLAGTLDAPRGAGSLRGQEIAYRMGEQRYELDSISLDADYQGAGDDTLSLGLDGIRLPLGGDALEVEGVDLQVRGGLDAHVITLDAGLPSQSLRLSARGGHDGTGWRGSLEQAALTGDYGDWELDAPTDLLVSASEASVAAHCWRFLDMELCANGAWDAEAGYEAGLRVGGLPLALLNSAETVARLEDASLSTRLRDKPPGLTALQEAFSAQPPANVFVDGVVDLEASVSASAGGVPRIDAEIAPAGLRLGLVLELESDDQTLRPDVHVFGFEDVSLGLGHADGRWQGAASFAVHREDPAGNGLLGTLDGTASLDAGGNLEGELTLDFADIAWVETLAPMVSGARGELDARAEIGGNLERPLLLADVALRDGAFRLEEYGLEVQNLALALNSGADNTITLSGSALSGEGRLALDGRITTPLLDSRRVQLSLRGEDFQVMNLDDTQAVVSPALDITFGGDLLDVRGSVGVPRFLLDLESSEVVANRGGGVEVSRDVVVVNAPPEQRELLEPGSSEAVRRIAVTGAVTLELGEDVRFAGYGLDIRLGGDLTVEKEAARPVLAYGEIEVVEGLYESYGQELAAEGRLIFLGNPLNPALDMRAFREIENATVGVQMSGTLRNIQGQLYSTPVLPESEILAILVTGKSFQNVGQQDSDSLLTAIANFGLERGQGITDTVRGKLGLDTLEVNGGSSFDESSLGLGKYITPDLFLRYDVGLFDRQSTLSLMYALTERLRLEVQTGVSQSVDLTYTVEK